MQGIVTDEKGAYVKAVIVKLYREKAPTEETETEAVTYAETDEKGRFIIQDLNPDEKYMIEIYTEIPEPSREEEHEPDGKAEAPDGKAEDPDGKLEDPESDEDDELEEEPYIIDSLTANSQSAENNSENASIKSVYDMSYLNDKAYLKKNNLW